MDDISVRLEHVDLLNRLDGLNIELLERCLQLLVVHACALMDLLDLSSRRAFSTTRTVSATSRPRARPYIPSPGSPCIARIRELLSERKCNVP